MSMLRAENVHKRYGDLEVLRGVTLEVEPGQVKVLIGPSGSGKSTLLRCLCLLEEAESGEVSLEGRRPGPGEVGMVFQRFNLFQNMTALANVMSAQTAGAVVLNHARVSGMQRDGDRVTGAQVMDVESGATLDVRARVTVNAAARKPSVRWNDVMLAMIQKTTRAGMPRLNRRSVS